MNKDNSKSWYYLTFLILISLHLKVFSIAGFDISLAFLLIPFWIFKTCRIESLIYNRIESVLFFILLLSPFITFVFIENWLEFFKTYLQFILSYFLFTRIIKKPVKIGFSSYYSFFLKFQFFLLVVVFFQFILVSVLNQEVFYNIFGDFQLYYKYVPKTSEYRMKAFYLEPSFLGFLIVNLYWIRLKLEPNTIFGVNFFLTLFLLFFTKSSFANSSFLIIFLFEFYSTKNVLLGRLLKFGLFLGVCILLYTSFNTIYSFLRLDELSNLDYGLTSGYMRIILPIEIVYNILFVDGYFFGLPFGQLDVYIEQFMPDNYKETSINNSFFAIISYWGIIGVLAYFYMIITFIKNKDKMIRSLILLFFLSLNNSGAFVTIQFVFVALILPLITFQITNYEFNKLKNGTINSNSNT